MRLAAARLEVDVSDSKFVGVADDVGDAAIFHGFPWRGEETFGHSVSLPVKGKGGSRVLVIHRISSANQIAESTVFVGLISIYPQDITN